MHNRSKCDMANNQNFQSLGLMDHVRSNGTIEAYYRKMAKDKRVITIYNGQEIVLFMTFSITNDYIPYAEKDTWEYRKHNPSGHICYIEKLASKIWDRDMRTRLVDIIEKRFPDVIYGVWHRPRVINGKDWNQKIIIKRRGYVRDKVSFE